VLVGVLSIQSQVFSTVHGSVQGAAMNQWCHYLEYLGEHQGREFIAIGALENGAFCTF
jgi:hypothetical protein